MRSIRTRPEAFALGLAAAGLSLLAVPLGCSRALPAPQPMVGEVDGAPRRGGTLHLASFVDTRALDPATGPDGVGMQAVTLLFEGLVDIDREGKVVPALARSWAVEDGGRTYRFTLRSGVLFHDGAELTAGDVKRSVERALAPATPNPQSSLFEGLLGYADYAAGKAEQLAGVEAVGRDVIVFRLSEPDAAFLTMMVLPSMRPVCASAGRAYDATWLPCGAGPFRIEPGGWQRGVGLRVVRHEGYYQPALPYLDAVEWTFLMETNAQRFRFQSGALDLVLNPTQADYARYVGDARWRGLTVPLTENSVWGEAMNTTLPPFDNVEVRRAVAAAVEREHYVLLRPANMTTLSQALPRGVVGYDPTVVGQRFDLDAAREHMRKAGYPFDPITGTGGWPGRVTYTVFDQGANTSTAQVLQQSLAKIGLRVDLRLVSYPAYLAITRRRGGSAFHPQGNLADYPDPSAFFDALFTTSQIHDEDTSNTAFYSSARFDELARRGRREQDAALRRAIYREADELLCDEAPWAFAWAQRDLVIRQPYVMGLYAHPVWPLDLRPVWLARDEPLPATRPLGGPR